MRYLCLTSVIAVAAHAAPPPGINPDQAQGVSQAEDELKEAVAALQQQCGAPVAVAVDWDSAFKGLPPPEGNFRDADAALTFGRLCVRVTKTLSAQCGNPSLRTAIARDVKKLTCRFGVPAPEPSSTKKARQSWAMSLTAGELLVAYDIADSSISTSDWMEANLAGAEARASEAQRAHIADAEKALQRSAIAPMTKACGVTIPVTIEWAAYPAHARRELERDPSVAYHPEEVAKTFAGRFSPTLDAVQRLCKGVDGATPASAAAVRKSIMAIVFRTREGEPKLTCSTAVKAGTLDVTCGTFGRPNLWSTMKSVSADLGVAYTAPEAVPMERSDDGDPPRGSKPAEKNKTTGRNGLCQKSEDCGFGLTCVKDGVTKFSSGHCR
ncbi:MAG: hypothetical protein Q8L14_20225 [Myxococcales bacterium]|nr:hypothetical protein [Myxococcales bacterium]